MSYVSPHLHFTPPPFSPEATLNGFHIYSHKTAVARVASGLFRTSTRYQRFDDPRWVQFIRACGFPPPTDLRVTIDTSLRQLNRVLMTYLTGAAAPYSFASKQPHEWAVERAVFHSTILQVLAPGSDTRALVDAVDVSRPNRRVILRDPRNAIATDFLIDGPDWYADLGGSKTIRDLESWLVLALAGKAPATTEYVSPEDAESAAARLGASLEELLGG